MPLCPCEFFTNRLFLAALLDALAASVQRALAASLLGQLLASLLVCRKAVRIVLQPRKLLAVTYRLPP
jgi:hypothetical protein